MTKKSEFDPNLPPGIPLDAPPDDEDKDGNGRDDEFVMPKHYIMIEFPVIEGRMGIKVSSPADLTLPYFHAAKSYLSDLVMWMTHKGLAQQERQEMEQRAMMESIMRTTGKPQ